MKNADRTGMEKKGFLLLMFSYIAFISLGLPDGLHGVAWPDIRSTFNLPIDAIGLVIISATIGYSLSGFFSAVSIKLLGIGGLLAVSCGLTAAAQLIYAITPWWPVFIASAFLGGIGAGAIDAGVNGFVEKHYSERLMQWLHGSFGIGITLGPIIMTMGIRLTGIWRTGYLAVCVIQGTLATVFFFSRKLWEISRQGEAGRVMSKARDKDAGMRETLRHSGAWLSMLMFFLYVGAEIGLGLWVFSLLTESRGVDKVPAGFITSSYWGMFTFGRFTAGIYSRRVAPRRLLYLSIAFAIAGVLVLMLFRGAAGSIAGIAVVGFAIAPVFPGLMSDTVNRVGRRHVTNTIGMQIAAAGIGAAAVPSLAGVLARIFGIEVISPYLLIVFVLLLAALAASRSSSSN